MTFLRSFERTLDIEGSKESVGQYGCFCREAALFNKRHQADSRYYAIFVLLAVAQTLTQKSLRTVYSCAER